MMKRHGKVVIADTSPIINLIKINHLDLLHELFSSVTIPYGVYVELGKKEEFKEEQRKVRETKFIEIKHVENNDAVNALMLDIGLHLGESEVIVLAGETDADLILMDEIAGRTYIENMYEKKGTVGVIKEAYQKNLIDDDEIENIAEILEKVNKKFDPKLINMIRNFPNILKKEKGYEP